MITLEKMVLLHFSHCKDFIKWFLFTEQANSFPGFSKMMFEEDEFHDINESDNEEVDDPQDEVDPQDEDDSGEATPPEVL